ncbi:MAG TPA: SufD family Fe-S cluster assembly protein [Steroidobacteraceae bacterium]|nr:SufD family Fe-S cluster assembly protein [Steroidobacteraceae bacterium]
MIPLPTNRDENWRYANLRPLAKARPDAVADSASGTAASLPPPLPGFERWVFVDGRLVTSPATSLARVLDARAAGDAFAAQLDDSMAAAGVDFALARINAARGDQVLHVALPEGAAASLELLFVASAGAASGTSYPRVQLHVGRGARLCLAERHLSQGTADSAINAAIDAALSPDAAVEHTRVQNVADKASCFDTLVVHVGERASYSLRTVTLGGSASRSTMFIKLAGRAARCELTAAGVANGTQTHDVFAEIEHAAPETVTRELFRGIAGDRGKLAFNGKIIVREHAHESDSAQSLKTLLTGSGAEAAARPQLEIYTDRVRAAHGATTGKLDDHMLFYLLSRGVERSTAQALLQWAFIEDAVSRVTPGALREDVERVIVRRLSDVASLGLLEAT